MTGGEGQCLEIARDFEDGHVVGLVGFHDFGTKPLFTDGYFDARGVLDDVGAC